MKRWNFFLIGLLLLLFSARAGLAAAPSWGARAIGMGGAYSAVADDGTAVYWNPAGITQSRFVFMPVAGGSGEWDGIFAFLRELSEGESYPELKAGTVSGAANLGLGFNTSGFGLHVFGDMTMYSSKEAGKMDITGKAQGALTLARTFTPLLAVGGNIKYVHVLQGTTEINKEIRYGGGSGWAVDLGGMFRLGETVRAAAVVRDFPLDEIKLSGDRYTGSTLAHQEWEGRYSLPTVLVVGGAVKVPVLGTLVAADLETPLGGGQTSLRVGLEQPVLPLGLLAVRVGGYTEEGDFNLTGGLGTRLGPVKVDVAGVWADKAISGLYLTAGLQF